MATFEAIRYEVKDRVAHLTLNRPEKRNAINYAMRKEVQQAYIDIKYNPDIWAAIITGEGKVFCAGKDLLEKVPEEDGSVMSNDEIYLFLRHIYKPIICAINGPCLAQGAGFALNSDILIMSERGSLGWPQVMRGISSVSGPTLLAQTIPWTQAMGFLFRGKQLPPEDCLRLGLVNEVVPHDELLPAAERWASEILESAPLAVRGIKEAARRGQNKSFVDRMQIARYIVNRVNLSEDSKEGIRAFGEKRKPNWQGK